MKYYSEKTNQYYDTATKCLQAEKDYLERQEKIKEELNKAVEEKKLRDEKVAEDKKTLVKLIDEADARLNEAKLLKAKAKEEYTDLVRRTQEEAQKILDAANEKVKVAAQERYDAISQYNKKYGTYTRQINGEAAAMELKDFFADINSMFKGWFR